MTSSRSNETPLRQTVTPLRQAVGVPESADKGKTLSALEHAADQGEVDQGRVRDVLIQGPQIHGTFTDGRSFQTYSPSDPSLSVSITARPQSDNLPWFVISWLPFVALIGVCIFLWRQMQGIARLPPEAHGRDARREDCELAAASPDRARAAPYAA